MAHTSVSSRTTPLRQPPEVYLNSFKIADWIFRYDESRPQHSAKPKSQVTYDASYFRENSEKRAPEQQLTFFLHKRRKLQASSLRHSPKPEKKDPNSSPTPPFPKNGGCESPPSRYLSPLPRLKPNAHTRSRTMAGRTSRLNQLISICDSIPSTKTMEDQIYHAKVKEQEAMIRWKHMQHLHEKMRPFEPEVLVPLYFEHMESEDLYKGETAAIIRDLGKGGTQAYARKPAKRG